jgi:RNA polymerase sigma-70 factor (ECF subfamily)
MVLKAHPEAAEPAPGVRNGAGLGRLLEQYHDSLRALARAGVGDRLQGLVDPSDLVQETFLEACRDIDQFAGTSEAQWEAWLRCILKHNLAALIEKQVGTRKRDRRRQVSLPQVLSAAPASPVSSPSSQAGRREATTIVAEQLARLPGPYREVVRLRNLESLPFEEVARRMGRTPGAVRVLWLRALERLRRELKKEDLL